MLKQTKKTSGRPYRSTNQLTVATVAIIALTGMGYVISQTDAGLAHTSTAPGVNHLNQGTSGHTSTYSSTTSPRHPKSDGTNKSLHDSSHLHVRDIADSTTKFWSARGGASSTPATTIVNNYPGLPATSTSGDQIHNHFDPNWSMKGVDTNNLWDGLLTAPRSTTVQKRGTGQTTEALSDIEHLQIQRQHPYVMVDYDGQSNGSYVVDLWVNKTDFNTKPIRLQLYDFCHSAIDEYVSSDNVRTVLRLQYGTGGNRGSSLILTGPEAAYPGTVHGNTQATAACTHPGAQLIEVDIKASDIQRRPQATKTLRVSSSDTSEYERYKLMFTGQYRRNNQWFSMYGSGSADGWKYTNLFKVNAVSGSTTVAKSFITFRGNGYSQAVPGIRPGGVNNAKTANANPNAAKIMARRWGIGFIVAPQRCDASPALIPSNHPNHKLRIYDADYYGRTRPDLYNASPNNGLPKYDAGGNLQPASQTHLHIFSTSLDNYRKSGFNWFGSNNWLSATDNTARNATSASLGNPTGARLLSNIDYFGHAVQQAAGQENTWTDIGQQINYTFRKGNVYLIAFSNIDASNDVTFHLPFRHQHALEECNTEIEITSPTDSSPCVVRFKNVKLNHNINPLYGYQGQLSLRRKTTPLTLPYSASHGGSTYAYTKKYKEVTNSSAQQIINLYNNHYFWNQIDQIMNDPPSGVNGLDRQPLQLVSIKLDHYYSTVANYNSDNSTAFTSTPSAANRQIAFPLVDIKGNPITKETCVVTDPVGEVIFTRSGNKCDVNLSKVSFTINGVRPTELRLSVIDTSNSNTAITTIPDAGGNISRPTLEFQQSSGPSDNVVGNSRIFSLEKPTATILAKLRNNQLNYQWTHYKLNGTWTPFRFPINIPKATGYASAVSGLGSSDCTSQAQNSPAGCNTRPTIDSSSRSYAKYDSDSFDQNNTSDHDRFLPLQLTSDSASHTLQTSWYQRGPTIRRTVIPKVQQWRDVFVGTEYEYSRPAGWFFASEVEDGWIPVPNSNRPRMERRRIWVDGAPQEISWDSQSEQRQSVQITPSQFAITPSDITNMLTTTGSDTEQVLADATNYPVTLNFQYNPSSRRSLLVSGTTPIELLQPSPASVTTSTLPDGTPSNYGYKLGPNSVRQTDVAARLVFTHIKIHDGTLNNDGTLKYVEDDPVRASESHVHEALRINPASSISGLVKQSERLGTLDSKYGTGQGNNAASWKVSFNVPPSRQQEGIHKYQWEIKWRLYISEFLAWEKSAPGYTAPFLTPPDFTTPAPPQSGLNSPPNPYLGDNGNGHYDGRDASARSGTGRRFWTYFEGTYTTCSRTLAVKKPICRVTNLSHTPWAKKRFNASSENATTNRVRQDDVFPVGGSPGYQHSSLQFTNNGGIQLQTTINQYPSFTITRTTPYSNTGIPPNYYSTLTASKPPDDKSQTININGGTASYEEEENAINYPGQFKSTWTPNWSSDAKGQIHNGSRGYKGRSGGQTAWIGEELKSSACTGSGNLSADFFIYAEPPSCEVVRTAIEIGDPAPIIKVTIVNPNDAPMRIDNAKYKVSTINHATNSNVNVQTGAIAFSTPSDRIVPASSSLTLTAPADTFQQNGQTNTGYGQFSAYKHDFIWGLQTSMGTEVWVSQHINGSNNVDDYTNVRKTWFEDRAANPNQEFIRPTEASRVSDGVQCKQTLRVVYVSFFKVYGGDVAVGGHFGSGGRHDACEAGQNIVGTGLRDNEGAILAYSHNKATWGASADQHLRGASTQYAVKAAKEVFGFLSAGPKNAGFLTRSGDPEPKKGLTFANDEATLAFGGNFGQPSCLPNYWSRKEQATPDTPPNPWSGKLDLGKSSANSNPDNDWRITTSGQQSLFHRGNLGIINSATNQILNPATTGTPPTHNTFKRTIYVEGDISIEDDIKLDNDHWKHPDESSYIFLIAKGGNIYIDPSVQRIDAVLVAYPDDLNNTQTATGGRIYTCQTSTRSIQAHATQTSRNPYMCRNQLRINGGVVAQKLHLGRLTHDTLIWSEPDNVPTAYDAFIRDENCNAPCDRTTVNLNKTAAPAEIFAFLPEFIMGTPADLPNAEDWIHAVDSTSIVPLNF